MPLRAHCRTADQRHGASRTRRVGPAAARVVFLGADRADDPHGARTGCSAMTMSDTLAIVILNYNTKDLLLACLASLEANPPRVPHTIVVVDNASTDGSMEAVRQR